MRRPDAWREWARRRHSTHLVLKGAVLLAGVGLVVAGAAMLVLPGPGWAAIFLGLVVLGSEFDSAARLRHRLQEKVRAGWSTATSWRRRPGSPTALDPAPAASEAESSYDAHGSDDAEDVRRLTSGASARS